MTTHLKRGAAKAWQTSDWRLHNSVAPNEPQTKRCSSTRQKPRHLGSLCAPHWQWRCTSFDKVEKVHRQVRLPGATPVTPAHRSQMSVHFLNFSLKCTSSAAETVLIFRQEDRQFPFGKQDRHTVKRIHHIIHICI